MHGLAEVPAVDFAIGRLRDIVKKILSSPKLLETFQVSDTFLVGNSNSGLQELCVQLNVSSCSLLLDCETRWNSTFHMLKVALRLQKPIEELLKRIRESFEGYTSFIISPADPLAREIGDITWAPTKDFCLFLEPFKDATELMSGSTYPSLGFVVPVFKTILEHVQATLASTTGFKSTHAKRFAVKVNEKLIEYKNLVISEHALVAAFLDPRIKHDLGDYGIDVPLLTDTVIRLYQSKYINR